MNYGRREQQINIMADEEFAECLSNRKLPEELRPDIFAETLLHPNHFPVVFRMLQLFGSSGKSTYTTEWEGRFLEPEKAKKILPRYRDYLTKMSGVKVDGDKRLWAASLGHASGNEKLAASLYTIMRKFVGPVLGYKTEQLPTSPGDYHLMFDWILKHVDNLKPVFIDEPGANKLERLSAMVGLNGEKVTVDHNRVKTILDGFTGILGNFDVEDATIKKPKLDPEKNRIVREGSTNITRDFERLFIAANSLNDDEYGEAFGVPHPTEEVRYTFNRRTGLVGLLLLGLLKDRHVVGRPQLSGDYPIKQIASTTGVDLSIFLERLNEIAVMPPNSRDINSFHEALDPDLGNKTMGLVTDELIEAVTNNTLPGYGAPNALLLAHCESKMKGDTETAKMLEKLMLYATRIASDPHTIQELGLDRLLWG